MNQMRKLPLIIVLTWLAMSSIRISPKIATVCVWGAEIEALVAEIAPRYGLDPSLVLAVIAVESQGKVTARSPAGACGLMQVMPDTCLLYIPSLKLNAEEIRELLFQPAFNIHIGCAHLRALEARHGSRALDVYSGGAYQYRQKVEMAKRRY